MTIVGCGDKSKIEYRVACRTCDGLQPITTREVEGGGQWVCATCGTAFGWWADGGKLDLDELRAVAPPDDSPPSTFSIVWDQPWR